LNAIVKFSAGCVALAMTLGAVPAWAGPHTALPGLGSGMAAVGQADSQSDSAMRQEAGKWLAQARRAMKDGNLDLAEYYVQRAEKLNVKYDALFARYTETPEKVRADLAKLRASGAGPARPSSQVSPPSGDPRNGNPRAAAPRDPFTVPAGNNTVDRLSDDSKAKAKFFLENGRRALEQKDIAGAIGWYQKASATGAQFSPGEFSPAALAAALQQAGVTPDRLRALPPSPAPLAARPGDDRREMERLPQVLKDSTDSAFPVIDNPAAAGGDSVAPSFAGGPANAKAEALRLTALARAALDRGDLAVALRLAEQAQAMKIPDSSFAPGDLRPWDVLMQVQSAIHRRGQGVAQANHVQPAIPDAASAPFPVAQGLYVSDQDRTRNVMAQAQAGAPPADGLRLYQEGLRALEAQDRAAALNLFRQAWQFEQQLDPATRQQLKDKLSLLGAADRPTPNVGGPPSALEEVGAQQDVLRQKMFREIANEQQEAEKMMGSDPRGALTRLQQLRDRVSQTDIDPESKKQLLTLVDRGVAQIEGFIKQHEQEIELNERNAAITAEIDQRQRAKLEVQDKIAELVEKYNTLVEEERFAEAEVIASQVRELDPESPIARALALKSKIASRFNEQQWLSNDNEEGVYGALTSAQASAVPFDDREPINFGDLQRWSQTSKNRKQWLESQRRQLSPAEMQIQKALKQEVEVRFSERPLKEVLETLGSLVGINIYPDPQGLSAEAVTTETPVTINLSQPITLKSALNLILEPLRLSYVIDNEVLLITSEQTRDSQVYTEVYNVADLVIPIPNFVPGYNVGLPAAIREAHQALGYGGTIQPVSMGNPMPLTIASNESQNATLSNSVLAQSGAYGMLPKNGSGRPSQPLGYGPGSMGGGAMADFDTLIELLTSTVAPDTWDAVGGPGAIEPFPTNLSLVISQTQDVHDQIADLLAQLRRLQDLQVTIEVRFITLRDDFFERMGVDFDFNIDDNVERLPGDDSGHSSVIGLNPVGQPTTDWDLQFTQGSYGASVPAFGGFDAATAANFGMAILSDIEVYFLLQAAEGDRRSNVLQAPKVTLFNGQLASVADTSQRPFVTSLVPVVGDFAAAHQPVIVVLSEGTSLSVQAVVSSDRRFVRLTLVPFFSQIGDVDTFTFTGRTSTDSGSNTVDPETGEPTGGTDNEATITEGTTVQLPTFSFTTVSTTVSVPDGGTVLLGGIKRLREGRNEAGVPMLSKLPYVNRLFKNVGIGRETQSLMLMVTPRIIIQEEEEAKLGLEIAP